MSEAARQVVTVEAEGLTLGATVALYHLIEKLGHQFRIGDVFAVECSIRIETYAFVNDSPDAEGLKQALENLRIDAFVSEGKL